ncbi:MAG: dipeptidase [Deltaproteobacteria bacterium]|nr:dipeptidase [Deltaproteobacteria bacterium]
MLARARALHASSVVADLHIDTLLSHELFGYDMTRRHRNRVPFSPLVWQADIPRAHDAKLDIWGMGLVTKQRGDKEALFTRIRRQLQYLDRVCTDTGLIRVLRTRADLQEALAAGTIGAFPGIEGAHAIGGDLDRLREAFDLGMRYFTLAHFTNNEACRCSMGWGNLRADPTGGLSEFGRRLVDEIHRLGVVLDLSHVNREGFLDACERSDVPVMVTHTGVRGVHEHWRNIDDEQIEAVAKTGGVVGIMFAPNFLTGKFVCDLQAVADHILHVVKVAGAEHAAYGSDMDGWLWTMPRGFSDLADLPRVTALLLDAGLTDDQVRGIIGGNVKRVLDIVLP